MRINRYLAFKKYSTRRGGDELIRKGKVFLNGKLATPSDMVKETDRVEVKNPDKKNYLYFAYCKPVGILSHSAKNGERDIGSKTKNIEALAGTFPLGRLDKKSHGLIILTNDGRITEELLSPENSHEKEYEVETKLKIRNNFKEKMETGVFIEGYKTKPCKVAILGKNKFSVCLTEGKKHQIRRMVSALHNEVMDLKRVRIMNIELGLLKSGAYRQIKGDELKKFLTELQIT